MACLSFSLLGPFQVRLDGEPVTDFESNKVRALLAYLAVEAGRVHRREALAELLWPGRSEGSALANLRYALYDLRNTIGDREVNPPFLLITRHTLQFNRESEYSLDVATFERYIGESANQHHAIRYVQCAVRLYQGPFLEGFSLEGCPAFEEWVLFKREYLNRKMVSALQRLAVYAEQSGDRDRARNYLRRQLALEPWDERAHRQLMRLLALSGQRSAALAQYEVCRRLLAQELSVEPARETTELYENIRKDLLEEAEGPRREGEEVSLPLPFSLPLPSTTFVARESELAQLNRFLETALAGQGRTIFVAGEAGSGKTALIGEFTRRAVAAHRSLIVLAGHCSAYTGIGDPYLPFREAMRMLTGDIESRRAGGAITREQAERLWRLLPDAAQTLLELGPDLIDLFVPADDLALRMDAFASGGAILQSELEELVRRDREATGSASLQQAHLFEQVTQVLRALARQHPIILVIDDLQWADRGSISLLFHLGRRLAGSRVLVVGIYRSSEVALGQAGERHPLASVVNEFQRHFGEVTVDLDRARGREFVDAFLDSEPNRLGNSFRETLYHHTGGNPLFVVELLRGLQEREDLVRDEAGRWVVGPTLDWERLPARVEAVVAERIDQLSPECRAMLTVASVEGATFTAEVIARAQGLEAQEVIQRLSGPLSGRHRLVHARSVRRLGARRLSRYRFRHYLFQKYLYNQLDQVERAHLHETIGGILEALYREQAEEAAVRLARHFEAAGIVDKAVDYLLQAGKRAMWMSANEEAIVHYTRGLELLNSLPDSAERTERELELQIALDAPLLAMQGWGAAERARVCGRAYDLCQQIGSAEQFSQAIFSLADLSRAQGELQRSLDLGQQMLDIAQHTQNPRHVVLAHAALGETYTFRGQLNQAHTHLERALAACNPRQLRALTALTGPSLDVVCLTWDAWALWALGYPEQALAQGENAVARARRLDHSFSLGFALALGDACLHVLCRDFGVAQEHIAELVQLSLDHDLASTQPWVVILQGWKQAMEGRSERGIARMREGLALWQGMGAVTGRAFQLLMLVEAYRRENLVEEALCVVDEGLALIERIGEGYLEAELHRLKGELLLAQRGGKARAEACFRRAIDVARRQQAKSWELRAAVSLSRWRRRGRRDETRELLSDLYHWFGEGFNTPDLQETRTLLETWQVSSQ